MAKGPFILHGASKKIGNMVVYKNPNSNNADTTVAREYVAEVKNPKTRQQAIQRMRMLPAQQFYRAFRELLDHSWQGIKYGGRSYAHFMRVALADKTITIPYLLKGTTDFAPGAYPISSGSLSKITQSTEFSADTVVRCNLRPGNATQGAFATVGALSTAIIENNVGFETGDFITFLFVVAANNEARAGYARIELNPSSAVIPESLGVTVVCMGSDKGIDWQPTPLGGNIVAAGWIHSRKPAEGSTVWQRSSAEMYLATNIDEELPFYTDEEAAIASYQSNAGNVNAHWYLNGGAQ